MNRTNVRMRLSDSMGELRRMRDKLRLEIHLARLEAKERWRSFKPMGEISNKLRDLRASLDETRRQSRS